jgi:hypothetical protein
MDNTKSMHDANDHNTSDIFATKNTVKIGGGGLYR